VSKNFKIRGFCWFSLRWVNWWIWCY